MIPQYLESFLSNYAIVLTLGLLNLVFVENSHATVGRAKLYAVSLLTTLVLLISFSIMGFPFHPIVRHFLSWLAICLTTAILGIIAANLFRKLIKVSPFEASRFFTKFCGASSRDDFEAILRDLREDERVLRNEGKPVRWYIFRQLVIAVIATIRAEITSRLRSHRRVS